MKRSGLPILALLALVSGCAWNPWRAAFVSQIQPDTAALLERPSTPPRIVAGRERAADEATLRGDGYVLIGVAVVLGPHARPPGLKQQARNVDASVVMLYGDFVKAVHGTQAYLASDISGLHPRPFTALSPCIDRNIPTTNPDYSRCYEQPTALPKNPAGGSADMRHYQEDIHKQTAVFWARLAR